MRPIIKDVVHAADQEGKKLRCGKALPEKTKSPADLPQHHSDQALPSGGFCEKCAADLAANPHGPANLAAGGEVYAIPGHEQRG